MKIVVSVDDPALISGVLEYNPAFIEIRLDRMEGDLLNHVRAIREMTAIPLIATLRSREEGGGFVGDADLWAGIVGPIAGYVDIVDVETRYSKHAPSLRSQGARIPPPSTQTICPARQTWRGSRGRSGRTAIYRR